MTTNFQCNAPKLKQVNGAVASWCCQDGVRQPGDLHRFYPMSHHYDHKWWQWLCFPGIHWNGTKIWT